MFFGADPASSSAQSLKAVDGNTQHLTSADTVPKGLTPSDWKNIRAAYRAHRPHEGQAPIIGDPIAQQAYLKASNTGESDAFGLSVAVSGDTVAVGAVNESSNATGINGDQTNNSSFRAGAVYIFVRNGTTWSQQAYLKASNTDASDSFGISVAVSGNTVVVGRRL
ncbi:MAG: FG-GAP repeat protein [Chthoniobacterales bacterium]|nr:FG-GAP repeat protein [Chthoniobacterales bacterium]